MSKLNLPNGATFSSFQELGAACGAKQVVKQTKDKAKLEKQRETFRGKHICPACKEPMEFIPESNIMVCTNEKCKGIKVERSDMKTGEKYTTYVTSYHTLDEKGAEIASNIFAELN